MKKVSVVLCLIVLLLAGSVGIANAAVDYVTGVSAASGWSDVNKTNVYGSDSLMCWAAAASNALVYTGWTGWDSTANGGTGGAYASADDIYAVFTAGWSNAAGNAMFAYEWWMTNRTESYFVDGGGNSVKQFPSAGLNFYPGEVVQSGAGSVTGVVWTPGPNDIYNSINSYITADRGLVAAIDVNAPGGGGSYSHAITIWGWDPVAEEIYITDSDDGMDALRTYDFYQSGGNMFIDNYSNLYTGSTDVMIAQLVRLARNDSNVQPNHPTNGGGDDGNGTQVPEPASLLLFGAGLSGVMLLRKKMS